MKKRQEGMKKRILKILLCVSIMLILLPFTALADTVSVNIGTTSLADGKYYTVKTGDDPSYALVDESDDQPSGGIPYLYYNDGVLTVSGDVSLTSDGPSPLVISGGNLEISGNGCLELSSSMSPTVQLNDKVLSLDGDVDFAADLTGTSAIPAIYGGTLQTADDYSGDILINSNKGNALISMTTVNLQTSGDISISGGDSPVIGSSNKVTLKGSTAELTSSTNGMLISGPPQVSITATDGGLSFSGNVNSPLFSSAVTLSADGDVSIENSGTGSNGIAIVGDLTITDADNVNILGNGGQAVIGKVDIMATGDVTISSQSDSFAVLALNVSGARNVTVTSNSDAPTIVNSVDISVSGDVKLENKGSYGVTYSSEYVSIITTNGSISVLGKGAVPVIKTSVDVTLSAKNDILVQRTDDIMYQGGLITTGGSTSVSSESGVVIFSSDELGTTITIGDNSPIGALYGGEISDGEGLNLNESTPTENTYYKAGNGFVIWDTSGKITLCNATISNEKEPVGDVVDMSHVGIALPSGDITIVVEGTNDISSTNSYGMGYGYTNVTLDGDGILNVKGQGSGIMLIGSLDFAVGSNVKLNGIATLNNVGFITTVYGNVTVDSENFLGDIIIAPGAKLTIPEYDTLSFYKATSITNNGDIINNGTIFLPYNYTEEQIEALHITGDGEIQLWDDVNNKYRIYIDGKIYAYVCNMDVDLSTAPTEDSYYVIGSGYAIFTFADSTLTLHNVSTVPDIYLPDIPITMVLEGVNQINIIHLTNSLTLSGNGTLNAVSILNNEDIPLIVNSGVTLNTLYNKVIDGSSIITVYGKYELPTPFFIDSKSKVILSPDSVLVLYCDRTLTFLEGVPLDNLVISDGAEIVNNSYIVLPKGTTAEQIAALPLRGSGIVVVPISYEEPREGKYYTNSGVKLNLLEMDKELTLGYGEVTADKNLGYTWLQSDGVWTLTLDSVLIRGDLTLLTDGQVVINTTADSNILGDITLDSSNPCDLTFTGTGRLGINGVVWIKQDGEVTVDEDANVAIGTSITHRGVNRVLTVNGTLTVSSPNGTAIYTGKVKIGKTGVLNVNNSSVGLSLHGINDDGDIVYDDAFVILNGGEFYADCTNANIEVYTGTTEATEDNADDVTVIPDGYMPDGYSIKIVSEKDGEDTQYAYTIAKTNQEPTLESEHVNGAGGKLTLKQTSNNNDDDNDDNDNDSHHSYHLDGSGGHSYKLSFDTNGGPEIQFVSKAYGTVIDLSTYKPVRDGYEFMGWYTDEELTNSVTSIKLDENTKLYAKWVQKTSDNASNVNPFIDVANTDYYHDAVLWAVEKGITSGTTSNLFSPNMSCTRAQTLTFLWKASGSPEPTSTNCPFTDVDANSYYYKAVLWAVENGIAAGTSSTTFSPDSTVTRAQAVTFMWRAEGKPVVNSVNPFTDVTGDDFSYNAIMWAVGNNITQGSSTSTFSSADFCTRGQIVSFLYREKL